MRYSGDDLRRIDRTYPQPLAHRWGPWADYRLADLRAISRFKQLQDRTSDGHGGLAAVLSAGRSSRTTPTPGWRACSAGTSTS